MKKAAQPHRSGSKGSGGIKTTKCLSLRENADSTKPESAPPAFEKAVDVGGSTVWVKAVRNYAGRLRSVYILK